MTAIKVVPEGSDPDEAPPALRRVPDGSPLFNLRRLRDERIADLHLDLEVPRWRTDDDQPGIVVRYRAMKPAMMIKAVEQAQKSKNPDWLVNANARCLVECCVAVYGVVGGRRYSLRVDDAEGTPTTFDPDLAEALGVADGTTAIQTARALYLTDGDVIKAAEQLAEWSNASLPAVEDGVSGE